MPLHEYVAKLAIRQRGEITAASWQSVLLAQAIDETGTTLRCLQAALTFSKVIGRNVAIRIKRDTNLDRLVFEARSQGP